MSVKIEKNNDRDSFAAKELQKFLSRVEGVMMIPKEKILEYPLLCMLLSEEAYLSFKDYGINKHIVDLLDDKRPILSIRVDDDSNFIGLSILDRESGLKFNLPDQPMGEALLKFLEARRYEDEICLMIGFFKGANIVFDPTIKSNTLLILDGYVFE